MKSSDFSQFMEQREAASTAFTEGDAGPLASISTRKNPASIFGPNGGVVSGAVHVIETNTASAKHFSKGAENAFEVLASEASGDLAYWTGIQRSKVVMGDKHVPMDLRVTEIFRKERSEWKLVHRHADMLVEEGKS